MLRYQGRTASCLINKLEEKDLVEAGCDTAYGGELLERSNPNRSMALKEMVHMRGPTTQASSASWYTVAVLQLHSHFGLSNLMDCSTPGFPVLHHLLELAQIHIHWVGNDITHCILCHPLLLLPSIFTSIRAFSNESAILIRWPKYWSFNFSVSPSSDSGLISFRTD